MAKSLGTSWVLAAFGGASLQLRFGEWLSDPEARQLLRGGRELHLSPKAFELLALLLRQRPRAVSKAEIRDQLWPRTFVSESNLTSLMAELRRALAEDPRKPRWIRTAYGFGYAFSGAVEERPAVRGAAISSACRLLLPDREVALAEGENLLGRVEGGVAWLESPTVSRRHARIVVSGASAVLEDLGSKNGTFVGGRRIQAPTPLADGDEIWLGRVPVTFRIRRAGTTRTGRSPLSSGTG